MNQELEARSVSHSSEEIDSLLDHLCNYWIEKNKGYWSVKNTSKKSYNQDIADYISKLSTHGRNAVKRCLVLLENKSSPESIFATLCCLTSAADPTGVRTIEKLIENNDKFIYAAQQALIYADPSKIEFFVDRWWFSELACFRMIVFPAAIAHPFTDTEKLIQSGLKDKSSAVRALVYKSIGENVFAEYTEDLREAFLNETTNALYEAASTLSILGDVSSLHYLPFASKDVDHTHELHYLMVWSLLSNDRAFNDWLNESDNLKTTKKDKLYAIAFRGDSIHLFNIGCYIESNADIEIALYVMRYAYGNTSEIKKLTENFKKLDQNELSSLDAPLYEYTLRVIGDLTLRLDKNIRYLNGLDIDDTETLELMMQQGTPMQNHHLNLHKKIVRVT